MPLKRAAIAVMTGSLLGDDNPWHDDKSTRTNRSPGAFMQIWMYTLLTITGTNTAPVQGLTLRPPSNSCKRVTIIREICC